MNSGEIIRQARLELDDTTPDYLWSDAELLGYLNEAEEEASRRARLLIDATTPEICTVTLVSGQSEYELDGRVIGIRSAQPSWRTRPLHGVTVAELDMNSPGWRGRRGLPEVIVLDYQTGSLTVCPTPNDEDSGLAINLRVTRLPMRPMVGDDDVPEIKQSYHRSLIHWIKHKAYLKKDADTLDKSASADALALFVQEFGDKKSAWADEFDQRNLPFGDLDGGY